MMVGETVSSSSELVWASSLLGANGERVLFDALLESGCIGPGGLLKARPLANFLSTLWDGTDNTEATLLWTLPDGLGVHGVNGFGYTSGVLELIRGSRSCLTLLAPYIEAEGIGQLQQELLDALARRVSVDVITQDANSLSSWASSSLELLRSEARLLAGTLRVYSAPNSAPVLLHSKLVVADGSLAIVGSANLTGNAMLRNLETGVLVGGRQAVEISRVLQQVIDLRYVQIVFSTDEC
ncbi:phospholipase D-like domain-containing protein [Pseudoduganella sp. R-31]|uniref:phospholipase D-like domain-containing protein n=1 Tax=Pseudoduganella sp. R-31 TaxID=3404060 RepID=UPI003CF3C9AE